MIKINMPSYSISDIIQRNLQRSEWLNEILSKELQSSENQYTELATYGRLWKIDPSHYPESVRNKTKLTGAYENRFVSKKGSCRDIYDALYLGSNLCPFCNKLVVSSLDHFLPKDAYPVLSITPKNLVPCCDRCQGIKLQYCPSCEEDQLLHPYFDDLSSRSWLKAKVSQEIPLAILYDAVPPENLELRQKKRIVNHFTFYNLSELYGIYAGEELAGVSGYLRKLRCIGEDDLREYLDGRAKSFLENNANSWMGALYAALIDSDWFCDIGVNTL